MERHSRLFRKRKAATVASDVSVPLLKSAEEEMLKILKVDIVQDEKKERFLMIERTSEKMCLCDWCCC